MYLERTTTNLNREFVEAWLMEHGYRYLDRMDNSIIYVKKYPNPYDTDREITDRIAVNDFQVFVSRQYGQIDNLENVNAYLARLEEGRWVQHAKQGDWYFTDCTLDCLVFDTKESERFCLL